MALPSWAKHFKRVLSDGNGQRRYIATCPVSNAHALYLCDHGDYVQVECGRGCSVEKICQAAKITDPSLFQATAYVESWQAEQPQQQLRDKLAEQYLASQVMPAFNPSGLPDVLQDYIGRMAELTEADSILSAISVITTLSSYAMHRLYIDEYFGTQLHPCLWSLTLSASGSYKSTGLRLGTQILRDLDNEYKRQIKVCDDQGNEERGDQLRKCLRSMPDTFSWQGLIDRLREQGGGTMMLSEFSSFLHQLGAKYNEGIKARLTSIYDVVDPVEERTRGKEPIFIEQPYVNIVGVSTIDFVRELISTEDLRSGFLARFLLFAPPAGEVKVSAALPPIGEHVQYKAQEWSSYKKLNALCRSLLDVSSVRVGKTSRIDKKARDAYSEHHSAMFDWCNEQHVSIRPHLHTFFKRWSPKLMKLSMLLQLMIDYRKLEPGVAAITAAASIIRYSMGSTKLLLSQEFGQSPLQQKETKVLQYIAKRGGQCTYRQLMQSRTLAGGAKDYEYICTTLVQQGRVSMSTGKNKVLQLVDYDTQHANP